MITGGGAGPPPALDPAIALVIAAVVGYHALRLAREVITALRDGPPPAPPGMPPASA